jgi:hypothetical protein
MSDSNVFCRAAFTDYTDDVPTRKHLLSPQLLGAMKAPHVEAPVIIDAAAGGKDTLCEATVHPRKPAPERLPRRTHWFAVGAMVGVALACAQSAPVREEAIRHAQSLGARVERSIDRSHAAAAIAAPAFEHGRSVARAELAPAPIEISGAVRTTTHARPPATGVPFDEPAPRATGASSDAPASSAPLQAPPHRLALFTVTRARAVAAAPSADDVAPRRAPPGD